MTAVISTEHRPGLLDPSLLDGYRPGPVLEVERVTKVYPSEPPVTALRGVSFALAEGELAAIVGPSGSGKTTLLQLMGTLDRPSAGCVRITGLDVAQLSDRELAGLRATRIGFVFQQFFLAEHQSALDNVADGLLYAGVPLAERRARAHEALALVGLDGRPQARLGQLSALRPGLCGSCGGSSDDALRCAGCRCAETGGRGNRSRTRSS